MRKGGDNRVNAPAKRSRWWWPRLRLSSVLWITMLVAICLAWHRDRQTIIGHYEKRLAPAPHWAPGEAAGPPNTQGPGDIPTAWASATRDDQKEWLDLRYARFVTPSAIVVHETHCPGALYRVSAFDVLGREHVVWQGIDPTLPTAGQGVSRIAVPAGFPTNRIKIYLDSPAVPGWNEIDAVGLVDSRGVTHWATDAKASSTFASRSIFSAAQPPQGIWLTTP